MSSHFRRLFSVCIVILALCGMRAAAQEEENRLEVSADIDLASKYIWRGFNVSDDAVLQPGLSLSYTGFTVGYWGNLELTDINAEKDRFTEHDFFASYSYDFGAAGSLEAGVIYYYFPGLRDDNGNHNPDAIDVYGLYSLSLGSIADFEIGLYYEVDEWNAWYMTSGLSREFALESTNWVIGTGVSVGYGQKNYNRDAWGVADANAGFNDLNLNISLSGPLSESVTAKFGFNYTQLLYGKLRDNVATPDNFWFMAGISVAL